MERNVLICAVLAACCIFWFVIATMLIYENLRRRGERVSFIWLRALAPWYASKYRSLTRQESGRTGGLFYQWVISINLALVLTMIAIVIHCV